MDPFVVMNTWTEKQRRVAIKWLELQWNEPSRTDHYLMRIAQRVQQAFGGGKVDLEDQKVNFKYQKPPSQKERVAASKAAWMGGVEAYHKHYEMNNGYGT